MRCKRKFENIRVANADECLGFQTQISKHPRCKRGRVKGGFANEDKWWVGRIILVVKTTKPLAYCERLCVVINDIKDFLFSLCV